MVEQQTPTRPQQMGETRLMAGGGELPIRLPPVADEDAGIIGANHRGRLREPAPGLNDVDGRVRGDKHPEPLQIRADAPTGFIGVTTGLPRTVAQSAA